MAAQVACANACASCLRKSLARAAALAPSACARACARQVFNFQIRNFFYNIQYIYIYIYVYTFVSRIALLIGFSKRSKESPQILHMGPRRRCTSGCLLFFSDEISTMFTTESDLKTTGILTCLTSYLSNTFQNQ